MFFEKDIETADRSQIEALQLARLKKLVQYCHDNIPFYRKRLDDSGVSADNIKSLSDIERIPFTTKEDIRDNYPYGLFAQPLNKVVRLHASSGTTGKPTVVGYTRNDLNLWTDLVARLSVMSGVTDEDVAQISFGYGLFTGALGLHYGLERLGVTIVPASSGNTERQIMLMKDFGATILVATPSYAYYMSEVAKELGYNREDFKLKLAMLGSEACTEEMRSKIEDAWGILVTDNYGMSELIGPGVSGECVHKCGMHIAEDHFLPELIDPHTLESMEEGEKGELIITTLTKEAFPLLRYRTKDITTLNYDTCVCGRTHVRMSKVTGRSDDMLKIKGVNVFPSQVESVIVNVPQVAPHYQIVLRTENFMDNMEVRLELLDGALLTKYSELEKLQKQIAHKLQVVLGLDAKITLVEPKSLERYAGKAKRIFDERTR
ncbi:MAG: phenylacetate--CoA ligase family protein [Eubacteriales bacterium]